MSLLPLTAICTATRLLSGETAKLLVFTSGSPNDCLGERVAGQPPKSLD